MKRLLILYLCIVPAMASLAQLPGPARLSAPVQLSGPARQLEQYLSRQPSPDKDSAAYLNPFYSGGGLHYLQPIYQYLAELRDSTQTKQLQSAKKQALARHFAFAGDHESAAFMVRSAYDSMPLAGYQDARNYVDTLRSVSFRPARELILSRAAGAKVVMFNEAPYQPLHRSFLLAMLKDLHQLGFRYLALEMLNNRSDRQLTEINMRTGYHSSEPVAGELIRTALETGFRLVAYEDTLADDHTGSGRDAIQASNLALVLRQDPDAKLLVLASGPHISEKNIGNSYIPMAAAFRRLTGIDPLTIDQVELTSGSSFEYGRHFHEQLMAKMKFSQPVIATRLQQPASLLENDLYDLQVIHPATGWKYNRPDWLDLAGLRKAIPIQPSHKQLFLVQAYYAEEVNNNQLQWLVPADQTYIMDRDGYYWLYLRPGKYRLVMRDISYRLLLEKELVVDP